MTRITILIVLALLAQTTFAGACPVKWTPDFGPVA
jgi:hypothetical protein